MYLLIDTTNGHNTDLIKIITHGEKHVITLRIVYVSQRSKTITYFGMRCVEILYMSIENASLHEGLPLAA